MSNSSSSAKKLNKKVTKLMKRLLQEDRYITLVEEADPEELETIGKNLQAAIKSWKPRTVALPELSCNLERFRAAVRGSIGIAHELYCHTRSALPVELHRAAARNFFGDALPYADPEMERVAAARFETSVAAIYAAAAAVPEDCVERRKILLEAMLAQSQLGYAAVYVKQLRLGLEEPFTELPLSTLPEKMQPHYRAALQRATGDDSGSDASDDDASDDESGHGANDEKGANDCGV
eukprot:14752-Heterococcus_DN1.PRE.2